MSTDSSTPQPDPEAEYRRRLELLRAAYAQYKKRDTTLASAKLFLLLASLITAIWILMSRINLFYWALLPASAFIFFVVLHERVLRAMRRCVRVIAFYERGVARISDQWAGTGETGERFLDSAHPYARDLDLFGPGSLFELLCTARTQAGEETLANWLLVPAPPDEVRSRNAAVTELKNRLDLREDVAVLAEQVRSSIQPEALAAWGEQTPTLKSGPVRMVLPFLSAFWLFGLVAWAVWDIHYLALFASIVNLGVAYKFHALADKSTASIEKAAHDLRLFSQVLARLEREKFSAPKLVGLQSKLRAQTALPSSSIARLARLMELLESRRHQLIKIIDAFLLGSLQLSFAIEAWRKNFGPAIRQWITAMGEIEALSDLAGYAYEHPRDVFPEFTEEAPCFDADAFAHPLIPESRAVRNDICLNHKLRLLLISGPNMAGKSTFIRAVGINAVLAQCGAPVRASRLRLSRLAVAASVCVLDSLQGGISRFYAEITRLKTITDLTKGSLPVLYLLDELLQGTNSHDRRIGAEAIVRSLFERYAIGLVTTHDLALTEIAVALAPLAANVHFEDRLEDGKLRFDHRLSSGIVQTSNALDLMRSIGLEV